jgi:putative chitinase
MSRIGDVVRQLAPHCNAIYLTGLDTADFDKSGIVTPLRQSHFLGQFLGETNGVVLQESGDYTHADRLFAIFGVGHHSAAITMDQAERLVALPMPQKEKAIFERVYGAGNPHKMNELGNRPGDGWPFRGTGPLQSTGRGSAKAWADKLGIAMANDQLWMLDPKIVFAPSLFEWDAGKLNQFADQNDGHHITRVINGGYNGLADRLAWQEKAYALLRDPAVHPAEAWQAGSMSPTTLKLQQALNMLGYIPKLTPDGKRGPATIAATIWFQELAHLTPVDGIAGPVTVAAINLRIAA